jgi:hypothetical protein
MKRDGNRYEPIVSRRLNDRFGEDFLTVLGRLCPAKMRVHERSCRTASESCR